MTFLKWALLALTYAIPCAVIAVWALSRFLAKPRKPLPPGPPRLPLIGNLHQAPELNLWRTFQQWTKKYGPIFYLRFGLQDIIVLGTAQSASDLLDKRGNIYSGRPRLVMGAECLSKGLRLVFMPYTSRYRKHQRLTSGHLTLQLSQTYRPLQDLESRQLVREMLSTDNFSTRFHRYASSFMFSLLYGKRLPTGDEPEGKAVGEVVARVLYAA
jgi:cytochrome P450